MDCGLVGRFRSGARNRQQFLDAALQGTLRRDQRCDSGVESPLELGSMLGASAFHANVGFERSNAMAHPRRRCQGLDLLHEAPEGRVRSIAGPAAEVGDLHLIVAER